MRLSASVIDIIEDLDEIEILVEYLNMRQKCTNNLCELLFLQNFPQIDNSPRHIIKYMFDRYINITCLINKHPNALIAFTFKYRTEDVHIHEVTLNNHMQFRNDILMICYVQHFLIAFNHLNKKYKVIKAMMILMISKYNVDAYGSHPELYGITFMNISASFLSIHYDILYNNFANFSDISNLFPDFNLPVMIYAPLIVSILPMLNDPPLAILMVIFLLMHKTCQPHMTWNIPLIVLYIRIVSFYYNSRIPNEMKLLLCRRYNIVILEGDQFKFAPSFAQYRQKAKDIISEIVPNDPNLEDILSLI